MRGVNKAIILGNLGHDVEVRQTQNGNAVANVRIATNERWTDSNGQAKEHTEWHNIVLFGRRAEIAAEYLHKGSRVYIEGRMRTREWQDREGNDRKSTEVIADQLQFIDRREDGGGQGGHQGGGGRGNYGSHRGGQRSGSQGGQRGNQVQDDGEIPF